jgi:type IV fimbrial biogenesis protein FimT
MRAYNAAGLSLLEALWTVALASILLAVATPAIGHLAEKQRLGSLQTALRQMIQRARYVALTQQQRVTLCPLSAQGKCQQNWNATLSTFIDSNGNRRLDPHEELLDHLYVPRSIKLHWRGMSPNNSMHFTAQGLTSLSNGTMSLCPSNRKIANATLTINVQGRTKTAKANGNCPAE